MKALSRPIETLAYDAGFAGDKSGVRTAYLNLIHYDAAAWIP